MSRLAEFLEKECLSWSVDEGHTISEDMFVVDKNELYNLFKELYEKIYKERYEIDIFWDVNSNPRTAVDIADVSDIFKEFCKL